MEHTCTKCGTRYNMYECCGAAAADMVVELEHNNALANDYIRTLTERAEHAEADRDRLRAELDVLRIDATRYKWLRNYALEVLFEGPVVCGPEVGPNTWLAGQQLDEAIDVALAVGLTKPDALKGE